MESSDIDAYVSNAVDVSAMPTVAATVEALGRIQRDRYNAGVRDEITEVLANAYVHLDNRDRDARCAERAFADAIRDVPWIEHDGRGDPPRNFPEYVQVRFRDGDTVLGVRWDWDQNWCWKDGNTHDGDIVAYRAMPTSSPYA